MREGMRDAAVMLWQEHHVHRNEVAAHLAFAATRMQHALDELHVVRVELEACSLRRLADNISTHLMPLEHIRTRVSGIGVRLRQ